MCQVHNCLAAHHTVGAGIARLARGFALFRGLFGLRFRCRFRFRRGGCVCWGRADCGNALALIAGTRRRRTWLVVEVFVPAAALQHEAAAERNLLFCSIFLTFRTFFDVVVAHALLLFPSMGAIFALVVVGRHAGAQK